MLFGRRHILVLPNDSFGKFNKIMIIGNEGLEAKPVTQPVLQSNDQNSWATGDAWSG